MARQVDFQNLPPQLIQVHIIDCVLGVLWRAERNEREPAVFRTWKAAGLVKFVNEGGREPDVLVCCEGFVGAVGSWTSIMSPVEIACQSWSKTRVGVRYQTLRKQS